MKFQTLDLLLKCGKEFGHQRIRSRGFSDTECLICSYVYTHTGCAQDDVVQALRIDKTTAARALQSLEDKGYIERGLNAADHRKKMLLVTASGEERISEVLHLHDQWFSRILSVLTPEEQKQFENYCTRLLRAAESQLSAPEDSD